MCSILQYRGFRNKKVYLKHVIWSRYTILVRNPRYLVLCKSKIYFSSCIDSRSTTSTFFHSSFREIRPSLSRMASDKLKLLLSLSQLVSNRPLRIQSRKIHLGKRSQIRIRCLRKIPEEGTNSGRGGQSGRCVQQSAVQTADGTPSAIWRQLDAHKMARSSTPGKKGCHATWKLDLHAPTTDNGTSTRLPSVPCPLQCLHKGTGGSEQQWFKPGAYACGRWAYLQNIQ